MDEKRNITGDLMTVKEAAEGHIALVTDYESLDRSMDRAKEKYLRCKQDFFNSWADDADFLTKCKRWQRAANEYLRWAGTVFNVCKDDDEKRQAVRDIMDKITKDSSIRHRNLCIHTEHVTSKEPDKTDKMDKAEHESAAFLRNAALTQEHFNELYQKGENYVGSEMQAEMEASARTAWFRENLFPKDHILLPGRVIPPYPVPRTQRVPYHPDPYEVYNSQPVDAYEYDEQTDELVLKEGYVSPDGLVDRDSVKYDTQHMKWTMKYRGGVPVTWDWWKPKDLSDIPEGWAAEYLIREYAQMQEDEVFRILEHRDYEDEVPEYNKIPDGKVKSKM